MYLASDAEKIQTDRNPDRLAVGLSQIHQGINNDHASELAQTIRLFDWTVRNIKLLNLLDNPTQEQIEEQRLLREEGDWAPSLGVKGPGYVRYTWQVLLYGHGDALERARVFIELLQELKIDAAIVELTSEADADGNKTSRTLVGVRIGDATYLFEPNLGVPVMVDNSAELATLEKLKADNGILKGLNLTVEESLETSTKYWPDELGIESINVKLYGTPEGLSSRMQLLEKSLTGQWRLKLVNNPSDTKENWEKLDSDKTVELWNVPFMIKPFRRAIDNALAFNDPQIRSKLFWYAIEERYLDEFVPFRRAKHLYLKGKLSSDSTEEDSGATAIYFDFIYQDELIQSLPVNTPLLESLGLRRPNQSQFDFENRVRDVQQQMYLIRADACFYTAMCHLESESPSPSTALNWLARVKDYEVDDGIYPVRWKEAVVYMTARIHESMGRPEQSIDMLKKDETSPQRHGNMLRARYINQLLNQKTNNND